MSDMNLFIKLGKYLIRNPVVAFILMEFFLLIAHEQRHLMIHTLLTFECFPGIYFLSESEK